MDKFCEGCKIYSYESGDVRCEYIDHNKDASCPCTTCVVKVMCSEECIKFKSYEWGCESIPF